MICVCVCVYGQKSSTEGKKNINISEETYSVVRKYDIIILTCVIL